MVDVSTKSCGHHGCFKRPTFGPVGGTAEKNTKNGQFCAQHALEGMIDVVSKRCIHPGCPTKRSFGVGGHRKNVRLASPFLGSIFSLFFFFFFTSNEVQIDTGTDTDIDTGFGTDRHGSTHRHRHGHRQLTGIKSDRRTDRRTGWGLGEGRDEESIKRSFLP